MTLEYSCSNCGALLQTTNADPLNDQIGALVKALTVAAERLEARGHNFGAREARAILSSVEGSSALGQTTP